MAEIIFSNAEQAIYYLLRNLRLSRIDQRFLSNLELIIHKKEKVTSNQVLLFNKIIGKYKRQLARHGFFSETIISLPWNSEILQSSVQYTNAHINIIDDKIFLKSPYNKNFINSLKKNPIHSLKWDKLNRHYEVSYSTYKLKQLINLVENNYTGVSYCNLTNKLLDQIKSYSDIKYWNPTLVYNNKQFLIKAANASVIDAIKNINFTESHASFAELAYYGISIDESVVDYLLTHEKLSEEYVKFLTSHCLVYEITEMPKIIKWLKTINCDYIFDANKNWKISEYVSKALDETKIPHSVGLAFNDTSERPVLFTFKMLGVPVLAPNKLYKVIRFVNSQPVKINK